jgi:hypothetical protein
MFDVTAVYYPKKNKEGCKAKEQNLKKSQNDLWIVSTKADTTVTK